MDSEGQPKMSPAITKMDQKAEDTSEEFSTVTKTKKVPDKNDRKGKKSMGMQPHLEQQFRIARLIDNGNKEDPKLKEKLKKIVEATQKSLDEAYTALHDCDYDINRAVNKLLEEENTEWSTLSKKKKSKSIEAKDEQVIEVVAVGRNNDNDMPSRITRGGYLRGRGRGGQGRWMSSPREARSSPGRRVFTNSTLEARTQEMLEANRPTRTAPIIRPVDNWDPNHPVSNLMSRRNRNEMDEEEYSGSLSKGLVFTSSNFGRQHNFDKPNSENKRPQNSMTETICPVEVVTDELKAEKENVSLAVENIETISQDVSSKEDISIANSSSLETLGKPNVGMRAPPMTASVLKAPPRSDKTPMCRRTRSSSIPLTSVSTKKPITPVEMPPDSDSVELLDITFGAVDLDENIYEDLSNCESSSELLFCNKPPPSLKPAFRNQKEKSIENLSKDLKIDSRFYETYPKIPQKSKSFCNTPLPMEPEASCVVPQVTSMPYTTSAGLHASPLAQIPYFNSQSSQQMSYYQNVIGGQTYTTNSQYGSSGLSSPSYSIPYQSYSSMVQGHKPNVSQSFSNEFDSISNNPATSMNYQGVPTSSYSIPVETSGKTNPQGKNMPALVGHHQVVLGQTGMAYYQTAPPPIYFSDIQMMQQQPRGSPHNYYEYPGSPPRDPAAAAAAYSAIHHVNPEQVPNMVFGDSTAMPFPGVCITPTESTNRNLKPPYQVPANQLVYRGEKPVSAPSQARSYN